MPRLAERPDSLADSLELHPIELIPPDLHEYRRGNTGVPWFITRDSGLPGPHTMITAVAHGNELCGAIVVQDLLNEGFNVACGQLTLGFLNVEAFHRFSPKDPYASRFVDEDFNRIWEAATLDGCRQSAELARARAVRPLVDKVDYLLDIHSMQSDAPPLLLAGKCKKSVDLGLRMGFPALIIRDSGHKAGPRLRDYGAFNDPVRNETALLVECGQHWSRTSVDAARATVSRFLEALGQIQNCERPNDAPLPVQRIVEVTDTLTAQTDMFSFDCNFRGLEIVPQAGTLIARDGSAEIRTPYDACVLIMPAQSPLAGQTAVRLGRFTSTD